MVGRISAMTLVVLSANLSLAGAVDYIAAGRYVGDAPAGDAGNSLVVSYQSVSSGLVTIYTPIVAANRVASQCVEPGVAYRPVAPPGSLSSPLGSAAACFGPGFDYRPVGCPLGFPGFVPPASVVPTFDMEIPAGVK